VTAEAGGNGVFWVRCTACEGRVNRASVVGGVCLTCRMPDKHHRVKVDTFVCRCGRPPSVAPVYSEADLCHWCLHEAAGRGECARPPSCNECCGPLPTLDELSRGRCDSCVVRWGTPDNPTEAWLVHAGDGRGPTAYPRTALAAHRKRIGDRYR